jgi:hypothetical protein
MYLKVTLYSESIAQKNSLHTCFAFSAFVPMSSFGLQSDMSLCLAVRNMQSFFCEWDISTDSAICCAGEGGGHFVGSNMFVQLNTSANCICFYY